MTPGQLLLQALAGDRGAALELGRLLDQLQAQGGTGVGARPLDRLADGQVVQRMHAQYVGGFSAAKLREIAWWHR